LDAFEQTIGPVAAVVAAVEPEWYRPFGESKPMPPLTGA
jgi:hypothetical protein